MSAGTEERALRLRDLIDLECQLAEDEAADPETLRRRDRGIGRELLGCGVAAGDRRALIRGWLHRVRGGARPPAGVAAGHAWFAVHALLWILGLVLGVGAASAVLQYDGTRPVNVALALVALVGAQWILLLLLALTLLPQRLRARLPGAAALLEFVELLSPGRWTPALVRVLPVSLREPLRGALGRMRFYDRLYAPIRNWSILGAAQGFAVAFNLGALGRILLLVAFTDLSFGWSTTLDVGAGTFHRWTTVLSLPWASFLPDAVPDRELVEATRYFRLDRSFAGDAEQRARIAALSGRWWSFLVAVLVVDGLAPRLLLLALARWRLASALRAVPLDHAGFHHLLERLTEELVETRAPEPETGGKPAPAGSLAPAASSSGKPPGEVVLVRFGRIGLDDAAIARCLRGVPAVARSFEVGTLDVGGDERALVELAKAPGSAALVVAHVAFEPPTRDFTNFLRRLRGALGERRLIHLLALAWDADGSPRAPDPEDVELWTRRAAAIGDPWLGMAIRDDRF
jgi:hypothetical protein